MMIQSWILRHYQLITHQLQDTLHRLKVDNQYIYFFMYIIIIVSSLFCSSPHIRSVLQIEHCLCVYVCVWVLRHLSFLLVFVFAEYNFAPVFFLVFFFLIIT